MDSQEFPVLRTSLVAQWQRLHAPNVGGLGFDPGFLEGNQMPHAATKSTHAAAKTWHRHIKKINAKKRFSCAILIFFYPVCLKAHAFSDFKITFICMAWVSIR